MAELKTVDDSNFQQEVLAATMPVVVDFTGHYCRPCKKLMPLLEELQEAYQDRVKFVKVYVEDSQDTASAHAVFSLPAIVFFKQGQEVARLEGTPKKETIEEQIKGLL